MSQSLGIYMYLNVKYNIYEVDFYFPVNETFLVVIGFIKALICLAY